MRTSVVLGSHTFYFGEIVAVHCATSVAKPRTSLNEAGGIDRDRLQPLTAFLDSYWTIGEPVLKFGAMRPK
jgi:flavin reductase (DIM6/NTAB) family NADH-FMN oxidoreductase RutF